MSLQLALCLLLHGGQGIVVRRHSCVPHSALNSLQVDAITLHAFPTAFYIVRQLFCGHPARQLEQGRVCLPSALFIPPQKPEEFLIMVRLDNVRANVDALVPNERRRRPSNELTHLVLALAAERAVEGLWRRRLIP